MTPSSRLVRICSQEILGDGSPWRCRAFIAETPKDPKSITNLPGQANRTALAMATVAVIKKSYTLRVCTRSGLCPLFLFLGHYDGGHHHAGMGAGGAPGGR